MFADIAVTGRSEEQGTAEDSLSARIALRYWPASDKPGKEYGRTDAVIDLYYKSAFAYCYKKYSLLSLSSRTTLLLVES